MEDKIIISRVKEILDLGNKILDMNLEMPNIIIKKLGKKLGTASSYENKVSLNKELIKNNIDEVLKNTIPHEMAHIFADKKYNKSCNHNKYWKKICLKLGGNGKRCANVGLEALGVESYSVKCSCKEHKVTKRIYNNMLKGKKYYCKLCKSDIVFVK